MFNWLKTNTDNSRQQSINGNFNNSVANTGDNVVINHGIPLKQLIELSKKLGVAEKERDDWIRKYQDLEKTIASLTDETAKQARNFLAQGNIMQAKELFKQEAQRFELAAKQGADAYRNLGALDFLENTQEALDAYRRATELDPDNADGWNQLGILLERTGKLYDGFEAYQRVLKLAERQQDPRLRAVAYGNLGEVYRKQQDWNKAIEMYDESLKLSERLNMKELSANQYGNKGLVLFQGRKEINQAIEMFNKGLAIHRELNNKQGIATSYMNLASAYRQHGELDKAIEMYKDSLQMNEELGRKEGMADNYANLGVVYADKGDKTEAKRYWQQSIDLYHYLGSQNEKLVQGWLDALK